MWIEFKVGIEQWELEILFSILHEHCTLEEEDEDDIVTALWSYSPPSIAYKAVDLEFGLDDDIDIHALPRCPEITENSYEPPETLVHATENEPSADEAESEFDMPPDSDDLSFLTDEECGLLKQMIAIEEKLDGSDHVVEVLLYITKTHCLEEDVGDLLNFMAQAMKEALRKRRFSYLLNVLSKLTRHLDELKKDKHWACDHVERFLLGLSKQTYLEDLLKISPAMENEGPDSLTSLAKFLSMLNTEAIGALSVIMLRNESPRLRKVIEKSVVSLARKDIRPMERVLSSANEPLVERTVHLLQYFDDPQSKKILIKLLSHGSGVIRKRALSVYLRRKDRSPEELLLLMDDDDRAIRRLVLQYLAQSRDEQIERILLGYLENASTKDPEHFLDVCRSLGKCASDRAIPYLKQLLFKWPKLGVLSRSSSIRYKGAVAALSELDTEAAKRLVSRIDHGFFRNFLRSA
jgi:ribosomal protein S15P/S13E